MFWSRKPGAREKNPCSCIDDPDVAVTFTQPELTGPYIVSTSITPCAKNIPTNTTSITFTFNKPLYPSSVDTTNANSNLRTVTGPYLEFIPVTSIVASVNDNDLIITWPNATLDTAKRYHFTIKGSKDASGNTNSNSIKDGDGVPMDRNYAIDFFTQGITAQCIPPVPPIITCKDACSNPNTPNLNPPGYHCLKAELRAGTSSHPTGGENGLTIKQGEAVFFDARSFSGDFSHSNLNLNADPYNPNSEFNNGISRYEICIDNCTLPDYGCSETTMCGGLAAFLGGAIQRFSDWGVAE